MKEPGEPSSSRRIRVLVVDDSAVMRSLLRMVLESRPGLEVAGAGADGREGLLLFERLRPDLVLLDIDMPKMNGLELISAIRLRDRRVPIVMCSTLTWRGARTTIEALARGATDYVTKPVAQRGFREGVDTLARELLPKILALLPQDAAPAPEYSVRFQPAAEPCPKIVVIGVSTGGPAALEAMLPKLPRSFPLPILIVQHMPLLFTGLLADRLNNLCPMRVREAAEGGLPERGVIDIARGDWHLELSRDFRLHLQQAAPENFCRPSVDVLFRSAAAVCSAHVLGIVLTGMGSDGLAGARAIRAAGGAVLVQDCASSVIWGMPGTVANAGLANKVVPLDAMASEISRLANCGAARSAAPEGFAL